ncbi:hypothetical protein [Sphingomonas sp. VNH70]|uniref:hypothetical protein n=1 Tax=Sphingomonas silueang TaxID=3156617 RepID=UPI0032B4A865
MNISSHRSGRVDRAARVRGVSAPATITSQRDPFDVRRENRADRQDARAAAGDERAARREDRAIDQIERTNEIERRKLGNTRFDNITSLRKEFDDRKEVQNFKTVLPMIAGALRIANNPNATGANDLDLIYTFGKVMDPGSVVREGELALASNTGSFAQNLEAAIQKIKSGEKLPPEVRRNLAEAMRRRGVEFSRAYNQTRQDYAGLAERNGFASQDVIGRHPAIPYQQAEADFTKRQFRNLDGSPGPAPIGMTNTGGGATPPIGPQGHSFSPANVIDFAAGLSGGKYTFIEGGGLAYNGKEVPVSDTIANSEPYREAYRAQFGSYPPLAVDVKAGELTPGAQTVLDRQRDTFGGGVDALVRGAADTLSVGLADPFAAAMNTLTGGGSFADNLLRERGISAADERVNPGLRLTGQVAGGIAPVAGAYRVGAAALPSRPLLGAAAADTGYGAIYGAASNDKDRLTGAAIGGATALAGNQFGQRVLAPAFRGLAATDVAQQIRRGFSAALDRPIAPPPVRPSPIDNAIGRSADPNVEAIRTNLDDAIRLGLPMSLADASPQLRTLAGSAVRRSPDARAFAEQALTPRAHSQGARAIQGINRDFGPSVNMRDEREGIINAGRAASAPLYDQAYTAPIVSTPELDAVLNTPFGRDAIGRARAIAANERRDPTGAGFALDAQGNPVLNPVRIDLYQRQAEARTAFDAAQEAHRVALRTSGANTDATRRALMAAREARQIADQALASAPAAGTAATQRGYSTQTLDYAKRGMDDIIEAERDKTTGRLNLNEAGRAQNGVRSQLLAEMDRYNPFYRDARSTYQGYARQADALTQGYDATSPRVGVDDLNTMTGRLGPAEQARFGQGYRTGLVERIEGQKFTGDPYKAVAGGIDQQAKLRALYPEGTPNFLRQSELERQMGLTNYEALGGSPTAGRAQADRLLDPSFGVQALAETGLSVATGVPPIGAMAGVARRGLADRFQFGMGQKKATALAPRLLEPNPTQALNELDGLMQAREVYDRYKRRTGGLAGMFGSSLSFPLIGVE